MVNSQPTRLTGVLEVPAVLQVVKPIQARLLRHEVASSSLVVPAISFRLPMSRAAQQRTCAGFGGQALIRTNSRWSPASKVSCKNRRFSPATAVASLFACLPYERSGRKPSTGCDCSASLRIDRLRVFLCCQYSTDVTIVTQVR